MDAFTGTVKPLLQPLTAKSLTIHGLVKDYSGKAAALRMPREISHLRQWYTAAVSYESEPKDLSPPDSPSILSPDSHLDLHLHVGEVLRDGESHTIYRVCHGVSHEPSEAAYSFPPMVIKVSAELEGQHLAEEAAMYDYLHSLQGVVIPRCYGYFRCFVNLLEHVVIPWAPECTFPRDKKTINMFRMPNQMASLNVLLLEDVGEPLPLYSTPQQLKELEQDLFDMSKELCQLQVDYTDWECSNILRAYEQPKGIAGLPSSRNNRTYKYRIIDFETACTTEAIRPEAIHKRCRSFYNEIIAKVRNSSIQSMG
ncbi:uncharacterized protein B0H18DRAFT_597720 [Fomitopsis serialis]|uniref:uncharacterized protein n=1 Tax=Fomitopsis serialis TaxID=139415 RepID=UPI002008D8F3|nr:uncharacterized protein B0H18DRAFT_597720 [Neoantrodia serialis]KAH9920376.1 hypothetical protein B0H18DRAFT_597720 [Neoantrodia serialis]